MNSHNCITMCWNSFGQVFFSVIVAKPMDNDSSFIHWKEGWLDLIADSLVSAFVTRDSESY